jgi:glycosyltransferase involved in cell wall biosynthesis
MTGVPLVSVVLPCYDVERYVVGTLDSLRGQTYAELEIVAIDDGSRDATLTILEAHANRDARIRVLSNGVNRGLIYTLNRGVSEARGEFIARMDADSIAVPTRLERQLGRLTRSPEIGVVGSAMKLVDECDRPRVKPRPIRFTRPEAARFMAILGTPLAHVTIMARASVMREHPYGTTPECLHTEDYELFTRLLRAGVLLANLEAELVIVRDRPAGVSWSNEPEQVANFTACARRHLRATLGVELAPGTHRVLVNRMDETTTAGELIQGLAWLDRLERSFRAQEPNIAAAEIRGVADYQRVDIVSQALLKGTPGVRAAAALMAVRYAPALLSAHGRSYLAGKLIDPRRSSPDRRLERMA